MHLGARPSSNACPGRHFPGCVLSVLFLTLSSAAGGSHSEAVPPVLGYVSAPSVSHPDNAGLLPPGNNLPSLLPKALCVLFHAPTIETSDAHRWRLES